MTERFILDKNNEVSYTFATDTQLNDILGRGTWQVLPDPPADMEYPSWNNADKKWESKDPRSYAEKRQAEYPSTEEQLDMIYHDMQNETSEWVKLIGKIKAKYPKE